MVEHFLPGGVKLAALLLEEPLLGEGYGFLGRPQDLHGPLELLSGLLGFNLGLGVQGEGSLLSFQEQKVAAGKIIENQPKRGEY